MMIIVIILNFLKIIIISINNIILYYFIYIIKYKKIGIILNLFLLLCFHIFLTYEYDYYIKYIIYI